MDLKSIFSTKQQLPSKMSQFFDSPCVNKTGFGQNGLALRMRGISQAAQNDFWEFPFWPLNFSVCVRTTCGCHRSLMNI